MSAWALRVGRVVLNLVVVVVLVVVLTSLLIHVAPGDPARQILGNRAPAEQVTALRQQMGLDQPFVSQLATTLRGFVTGDLGTSFVHRDRSVLSMIVGALPVTAAVVGLAVAFSAVFGLLAGLLAAMVRRRAIDHAVSAGAVALFATPPFVLSLLLLLVLGVWLAAAPVGGWGHGWPDNLRYTWLPALALSGVLLPQIVRTVRQAAGDVHTLEFVEAGVARGISPLRLAFRHVLPNASLPVITVLGFNVAALITGAVVVEAVFGVPGFGGLLQDAIAARDYPVIQGVALASAVLVVLLNAVTDLTYAAVDPRVRRGGA